MDNSIVRIVVTPGEPAGIGPDLVIQIAQQSWSAELIVIADPDLLSQRAEQLKLPLVLKTFSETKREIHSPGSLTILPVALNESVTAGKLSAKNSEYVLNTLTLAGEMCLQKKADAIVTGPVHKSIMNEANIHFSGHTEFFAQLSQVKQTVMLFVVDNMKVALLTTHLPLSDVAKNITQEKLTDVIKILDKELREKFAISKPNIFVCGLNPHAGENGHLGREEIEIISPLIKSLNPAFNVSGPFPADTVFTPQHLAKADVILAMYHDQALPVVKYAGFDKAVNVTLGLPFIRTSVDHGTALDLAGSGKANIGSMKHALKLAIHLSNLKK